MPIYLKDRCQTRILILNNSKLSKIRLLKRRKRTAKTKMMMTTSNNSLMPKEERLPLELMMMISDYELND